MPKQKISSKKLTAPTPKDDISFFEKVYQVVRLIPKGRVTSYGAIAAYLGSKGSARMVGWAMNAAHNVKPAVPAHRVVNSTGLLTGKLHFGSPTEMQRRLEKEKIKVENDQVKNFKNIFWDPTKELEFK
ncbi:MAG TPA: MGMT family protein [Bacteroidia bacterium]|nr:MGMT family protein [Bacteroidia bacterium]HNU32755.1 MGMT family protein [Bacteroidia bacterium]